MEFVKNHQSGIREFGIMQQALGEQAFGQEFDARARSGAAFEADVVTDGVADRLTVLARHESSGGARRETPRFKQQNLAPFQPGCVQQGRSHARGFAGAGRCLQHGCAIGRQ